MQHAAPDPLTGTVLEGRYELGPRIARGGTAAVYRAVDTRLERTVAVKLMHPHLAEDPAAADRFMREARAAAKLSHPHVVSVLDQGRAPDGLPYLVMELVEGSTLRDLLHERGALTAREALEVLDPVLDGLAAAHRAGLVHRDVKPENVLIGRTGRVTVADFGLTRAVDQNTPTGTVLGTVGYAAPELVAGRAVDARSDVYSAGIVLFELLAGRRPFVGAPLAVARAHVEGAVPDVRSLAPGVPPAVALLVARATAREPARRPADAGRLLAELRTVRAGLRPGELDRRPGDPPPRHGDGPAEVLDGTTGRGPAPGPATEVLGRADDRTRVLGVPGPAAAQDAAALPRGSSDPWRPAIELRPVRPLRTAAALALVALAVAAAAFLGWLIGSAAGASGGAPDAHGTLSGLAGQHLTGAGRHEAALHGSVRETAGAGAVPTVL
ncbi:MAG TPA: protein kinase [Kocuria rosea]|nr:protein kinase [Kocuria rosea]